MNEDHKLISIASGRTLETISIGTLASQYLQSIRSLEEAPPASVVSAKR